MPKLKNKKPDSDNTTGKRYNLRKDSQKDKFEHTFTSNMVSTKDTEKGNGHASNASPSSPGHCVGQSDVCPAGQPTEKLITADSDLKCAIKQQITDALCSTEVIDIITQAVCDAVEERLKETVTAKVYDAINMDLEKKCSDIKKLKEQMESLEKSINKLETAKDEAEQYSRRNCLTIQGVRETPDENTDEKVLAMINQHLGLNMGPEAIDRSHRIYRRPNPHGNPASLDSGQRASYAAAASRSNPRAIVVKFTRYNQRQAVYRARTKLRHAKGEKIFIRESLTNKRVQLYRETLQNENVKSVWSQDGKVFAFTKENKRVHIHSSHDLEKL